MAQTNTWSPYIYISTYIRAANLKHSIAWRICLGEIPRPSQWDPRTRPSVSPWAVTIPRTKKCTRRTALPSQSPSYTQRESVRTPFYVYVGAVGYEGNMPRNAVGNKSNDDRGRGAGDLRVNTWNRTHRVFINRKNVSRCAYRAGDIV